MTLVANIIGRVSIKNQNKEWEAGVGHGSNGAQWCQKVKWGEDRNADGAGYCKTSVHEYVASIIGCASETNHGYRGL